MGTHLSKDEKGLTVTGTLTTVANIGGETTGLAIKLDDPIEAGGATVRQVEINHDPDRWREFVNKHIKANGQLTFRTGIERRIWPVLDVETMAEIS